MRFQSLGLRILCIVVCCATIASTFADPVAPSPTTKAVDETRFRLLPPRPSALQRQLKLATSDDASLASADVADPPDVIFWDAFELCGNGAIDSSEACDRDNLDGQTCTTAGYTGGTLSCTRQCQLDASQCTGKVCTQGVCNVDADCGAAQCGPCFLNTCIGFQGI